MNCLYDGRMASRGKRIVLTSRKAGFVASVNVASHDALIMMMRERRKPALIAKVS